ncbi:MAG: AAA family ATPase [Muribaculaceae bacterium]|nr:AAA family ATPase [Muribaculaceae bacterium]
MMMAKKKNPTAPELTSEPITAPIFLEESALDKYRELLSQSTISADNPEPEPETLLWFNGTPILERQRKAFVCSVAKGRKTTTLTMFAAMLCGHDETANGFKVKPGCKVLYLDTEQARFDTQRILTRTAKLCGKTAAELPIKVLSLNKLSADDIRGVMELAIMDFRPDMVILDNWTDCVASIMEEKECVEFSRNLRVMTERYDIALISVIHANESARNDDKPNFRGWGAEEARKSDLTMFLKDMGDYSRATFGRCRGKRPQGFNISINDDGLPYIFTDTPESEKPKNPDKYAAIIAKIPLIGLQLKELTKLIHDTTGKAERTCKDLAIKMGKDGILVNIDGRYYLPTNAPKTDIETLPF